MFYTFDFGVQIVNICQESPVIILDLKKCLTFYVFIETLDKLIAATVRVCSGAVKIVFYFYVFNVTFIQQQQQQ